MKRQSFWMVIGALGLVMWAAPSCRNVGSDGSREFVHEFAPGDEPTRNPRELWIVGRASRQRTARAGAGTEIESEAARDRLPPGGELRAKLSGREKQIPLPLKHTDVKADVAINVASVTVKQEYQNPYSEKIEAVYVFPLPEDAAVRDFVMTIGERHIRGIIREREEAQRIYLEARKQGYVASLLTEERPNIFTQSVANIEPGKGIDIDITYFHTLKYSDGQYEFVFPMTVGPRYNPPGFTQGVGAVPAGSRGASGQKTEVEYLRPGEISSNEVSLAVSIDAGLTIERLESPSHAIDVQRPSPTKAVVSLSPGDRIPNKDFVLRYQVAGNETKGALAVHQDESGGYFTLVLAPPASLSEVPSTPREMVFVLDCSGSMEGEPLAKAKSALKGCLQRLGPGDTFQIVRFSDSASAMGPAPIPAAEENVHRALRHVDGLKSEGGTNMIEGIKAALDFPHDEGRFRIVAFLTDGYIGNDREIIGEVKKRLGSARIFSFGVGTSVNRYLLEGLARVGRGAVAYVSPDEPDIRLVDDFYRRVEHPAMTDIHVDWGGLSATDVYPSSLPDLFVGRPVILTGRFAVKGGKATVRVEGKIAGRMQTIPLALDLDAPGLRHPALACLWARSKIAELYDQMTWSYEAPLIQTRIKDVALQYGLLSDFTSFVAVDSQTKTAGDHGTSVTVPALVPKGVRYETTVGEK